jgi:hypothetical protein
VVAFWRIVISLKRHLKAKAGLPSGQTGFCRIKDRFLRGAALSAVQIGAAARTCQSAGGGDLVTAGRAVEPELAITTLLFIQALFFTALGALPVHFALFYVIGEQQPAAWTFLHPGADGGTAGWQRADKNGLAGAAPVFTFFLFLTDWTFFHNNLSKKAKDNQLK